MECVFRDFLLGDGAVCGGGGGEEERGFSVGFCGGESHRLRFGFGSRLWGSMRENFDVENEIRGFEFRSVVVVEPQVLRSSICCCGTQ